MHAGIGVLEELVGLVVYGREIVVRVVEQYPILLVALISIAVGLVIVLVEGVFEVGDDGIVDAVVKGSWRVLVSKLYLILNRGVG